MNINTTDQQILIQILHNYGYQQEKPAQLIEKAKHLYNKLIEDLTQSNQSSKEILTDALIGAIAQISEDYWCASWLINIEYHVYKALKDNTLEPHKKALIAFVNKEINGWVIWSKEKNRPEYIAQEDWDVLYNNWEKQLGGMV